MKYIIAIFLKSVHFSLGCPNSDIITLFSLGQWGELFYALNYTWSFLPILNSDSAGKLLQLSSLSSRVSLG